MIKLLSTVSFILINEEDKILLIKQSNEKKADGDVDNEKNLSGSENEGVLGDRWMIPSADLEESDNPRDAIKEKIKKYLNYEVKDCNYFNIYFYDISDNLIKKVSYFYGKTDEIIETGDDLVLTKWITQSNDEVENLNLMVEQKEVLKEFINFLKK